MEECITALFLAVVIIVFPKCFTEFSDNKNAFQHDVYHLHINCSSRFFGRGGGVGAWSKAG